MKETSMPSIDDVSTCQGFTALSDQCGRRSLYIVVASGRSATPRGACGLHLAQLVKYTLSAMNTVTVRKADR